MIPDGLAFALNASILLTELPLLDGPRRPKRTASQPLRPGGRLPRQCPTTARSTPSSWPCRRQASSWSGSTSMPETCPLASGAWSLPGREKEFRESVAVLVSIAERTGCRAFNALYGQRLDGVDAAHQDEIAVENLAFAAKAVAHLEGTVLVEPLTFGENGAYPLLTAADALAVVDRVTHAGPENVKLLADLYHLAQRRRSRRGPPRAPRPHRPRPGR